MVGSLVNLAAQKAEDDRRLKGYWLSSLAAKWGEGGLGSVGVHVVLRSGGTIQWCAMGGTKSLRYLWEEYKVKFPKGNWFYLKISQSFTWNRSFQVYILYILYIYFYYIYIFYILYSRIPHFLLNRYDCILVQKSCSRSWMFWQFENESYVFTLKLWKSVGMQWKYISFIHPFPLLIFPARLTFMCVCFIWYADFNFVGLTPFSCENQGMYK